MQGTNLVKKMFAINKLALYQIQTGWPNQQIIKFFFTKRFLQDQNFQILQSRLAVWCMCYEREFREFGLLFENTMKTSCCFIVYSLNHRPPSMFPLHLDVDNFYYTRSQLLAKPIPVLNWQEKSIIPSSRYVFKNSVSSSNFAYSATIKPRS